MSKKQNGNKDVSTNSSIAEEMYEKNSNPKNSYDAKSTNKNLKK